MRKRHPFHGGARSARDTEATRGRGPTRGLGSERGPGSAQGTIPTVPAQYVIGPIDPAQLLTLQVRLPNDQQICLLVPARLPHSVLNRTLFSEGCRWGCFASEDEAEAAAREERSVPKLLNSISLALHAELWGERNRDDYAWVIGFLLGKLTSLAATERMLALVGFAHLRFLLSSVPLDRWSCNSSACMSHMEKAHKDALRAYRAHVRLYREQGRSFQEAQRLALAGYVGELPCGTILCAT